MRELDEILSDDPIEDVEAETEVVAEEVATEEKTEETPEQPVEAEAEPEEDPRDRELAGLKAALAETRGELRAFKAQSQPVPEAKPAPDVLDDPNGFTGHLTGQVQQMMISQRLETSRFLAEKDHGAEIVNEAFQYFEQHPEQSQAFANHPSPFHAAVEAYKSQKAAEEIGADPSAWKERERERIREELKAEMSAQQVAENVKQVGNAPSLATEPNLGSRAAPSWNGPTPFNQLLG